MTTQLRGPLTWELSEDERGYKDYKIIFLVKGGYDDGPRNVRATSGLPVPWVTTWDYFDDTDTSAICRRNTRITPVYPKGEKGRWWEAEYLFSNKPSERCGQEAVDTNPLREPVKISFSFGRYQEEGTHDRFGDRIVNSAHEQIRGPQNEWDASRIIIKIEQNLADPRFDLLALMADGVNEDPMWGFPARTIKMGLPGVQRNYWRDCRRYYTRTLEFEIKYKARRGVSSSGTGTGSFTVGDAQFDGEYETWDRDLLDEGTKVLSGRWNSSGAWRLVATNGQPVNHYTMPGYNVAAPLNPDPQNPRHFIRFKDRRGENCRVILDGEGLPAGVMVGSGTGTNASQQAGTIHVEKYPGCNFWLLDIPGDILPVDDWSDL